MWFIRPVRTADLDHLVDLSLALGRGMTTFPPDRATIAAKIEASVRTFRGELEKSEQQFLLVLEDRESGTPAAISAVYPAIGYPHGFFSFHLDRIVQYSSAIRENREYRTLTLSNAYTGATEVGTLAVHPRMRGTGVGRLMARARYVLFACFPTLFSDMIIAELRGWQDEKGNSPFWDGLGRRFFDMDFASADLASATAGNEFIAELMPKLPLYLDLLPDEAANCVGKAHSVSAIAMKMLVDEGFRQEGYVDIFDGGPQLAARRGTIRTVRKTRFVRLGEIAKHREEVGLIAKPQLDDFRMVAGGEGASLDEMASALALSSEDVAAVCFD